MLVAGLAELGEHAAPEGVRVLFEPLNRYEDHMVNRLDQGAAICRAVGSDAVKLVVDTYHMNIEEDDPADCGSRSGRARRPRPARRQRPLATWHRPRRFRRDRRCAARHRLRWLAGARVQPPRRADGRRSPRARRCSAPLLEREPPREARGVPRRLPRPAVRGRARSRGRPRARRRRDRHRQLPRRRPLPARRLLADRAALDGFRRAVERPRPDDQRAQPARATRCTPTRRSPPPPTHTWRSTVQLAAELGVAVVNAFSGCPGDHDGAVRPNWVTCSWPTDYPDTLAVAVGREGDPVLDCRGRLRRRSRRHRRHRDASRVRRVQPGDADPPPRRAAARRSPPTSTRATCSGRASTRRRHPSPRTSTAPIVHVDAKDTLLVADRIALNGVLETRPAADVGRAGVRCSGRSASATANRCGVTSSSRCDVAGYDGTDLDRARGPLAAGRRRLEKAVTLLAPIRLARLGTVTGVDRTRRRCRADLRREAPADRSDSATEWCGFASSPDGRVAAEPADWDVLVLRGSAGPSDGSSDRRRARRASTPGSLAAEIDRASGAVRLVTAAGHRDRRRRRSRGGELGRRPSSGPQAAASATSVTRDSASGPPSTRRPGRRRSGTSTPATTGRRPTRCTARFPVFLAHRPDVTYGFFLNTPGWAQIRAAPGLGHLDRRGRRRRARLRRRPRRRDPAASARTTHRPDRAHRAATAVGDRLSPIPLGLRLGGEAAWRRRRVRPRQLPLRLGPPRHRLHGRPSGVHVGPGAIPRSGVVGRRPRTARDAMCDDRRSRV